MEFKFEGNSLKSGIYKITNKLNGRIYIGSAKEFKNRWKQHAKSLEAGKHHNKFLQADFAKCGEQAFLFEVLEVVEGTREERLAKEEVYLKQWFDNGKQCYNLCDQAISREGKLSNTPKETFTKCSDIQKQLWKDPVERQKRIEGKDGCRRNNIGEASKLAWTKLSLEERKALSEKRKELTAQQWKDPEIRARRLKGIKKSNTSARQEQRYKLLSPAGEIVEFVGILKFCEQNKLDRKSLYKVFKGIFKQHKGWKLPQNYTCVL